MKIAAFLAPLILAIALPPTQEEAQRKFDAAVANADHVIVEAVRSTADAAAPPLLVIDSTSEAEIRALSRYVRLTLPRPQKEIVDGEEVLSYRSFVCGCRGQFAVTLKKKDKTVLSFTIFHGVSIGSSDLLEDSQIRVDKQALAPFYARLIVLYQKKEANPEGSVAP